LAVKAALLSLALLLGCIVIPAARAQVALPPYETRVTDLTGALTAAQQAAIEEKLAAFERRKGAQIAVLIVPTTGQEDIAQFGIRLAEAWKLGRARPDDGAIFIIARDDRTMRVEVGRGLEGALSDIVVSRILNDTVVPLFRAGDFHGGVNAGVDQILRVVDGEALPATDQTWPKGGKTEVPWVALLFGGVILANFLRPLIGRGPGAGVAGLGGGGIIYWLTASVAQAAGVGVLVFVLALVMGFGHGFGYGGRGSRVFRDASRWGGGGGFGGFGGGGLGGGGGSFGGGGASARW
jgi:uncharacterized protein